MIKIITFLKKINAEYIALALSAIAFLILGIYIYILKSSNENLEAKIKEIEKDREQMSGFIHNQQIAINELEANLSEKEALACEITAQKSKIIAKGAKNEVDNTTINSAVSFITSRLREQNATK